MDVVVGLDFAARVGVERQRLDKRLLRPEETHGKQHELRGRVFPVPGYSWGTNWSSSFLPHFISTVTSASHPRSRSRTKARKSSS